MSTEEIDQAVQKALSERGRKAAEAMWEKTEDRSERTAKARAAAQATFARRRAEKAAQRGQQ